MAKAPMTVPDKKRTIEAGRPGDGVVRTNAEYAAFVNEPLINAIEKGAAETAPTWHGEAPSVYVWDIPGENGYALRLEITDAEGPDHARSAALDIPIECGMERVDNEDKPKYRSLTQVESNWVRTTAPLIVVDKQAVTIEHAKALEENDRLKGQNTGFAACQKSFATHGIDIFEPEHFVNRVHGEAAAMIADAQAERDLQLQKMSNVFGQAIAMLENGREATGFAPPKPKAEAEPDYSKLTVYADWDVDKAEYKRLSGALWINRLLDAPLERLEREGIELLVKMDGVIESKWRRDASQLEQLQLKAAQDWIKAHSGV